MRIGFITYEDIPSLLSSEKEFAVLAKGYGINIKPVIWTKDYELKQFDFIVIRTCWDYFLKFDEFCKWLDRIEKENIIVWNSLSVIRKNIHKFYLKEIQKLGAEIIPTVFIKKNSKISLAGEMEKNKWNRAVIKPAVSGGAYKTHLVEPGSVKPGQNIIDEMLQENDVLLQKYSWKINSEGEWSMIFFNKKYSHSVLKKPSEGDFRVQAIHGGRYHHTKPPEYLIAQAQDLLDKMDDKLLYARVDGVNNNGLLNIMELELIEPELFLETDHAKQNFLDAILSLQD